MQEPFSFSEEQANHILDMTSAASRDWVAANSRTRWPS